MSDCSIILVADRNLSTNDIEVRGVEDHCEELSFSISNYDDYKSLFIDEFKEVCSRTKIVISGYYKSRGALLEDVARQVKIESAVAVEGADRIAEYPNVDIDPNNEGDSVQEDEGGEPNSFPGIDSTTNEQAHISEDFKALMHSKYEEYGVMGTGGSPDFTFDPDLGYAPEIYRFTLILATLRGKSTDDIYTMLQNDLITSGIIPAGWEVAWLADPEHETVLGEDFTKFVIAFQSDSKIW